MLSGIRNYFFKETPSVSTPNSEACEAKQMPKSTKGSSVNNANTVEEKPFRATHLREGEGSSGVIDRVYNRVREYFYQNCKGKEPAQPEKINEAMRNIGGEGIDLEAGKDVNMRGMFFGVDSLLNSLKEAGAQKGALFDKQANESIPAFVFDPTHAGYENQMKSLEQMGFFKVMHTDPASGVPNVIVDGIWEKREIDGKIYVFTNENFAKLTKDKAFPGGKLDLNRFTVENPQDVAPTDKSNRHVVILNGAIYSRFESLRTASEIAKLLSLGVDVIVSEDKHPRIVDTESHECVMANRKAVYQKLCERGYSNEQMIWKGTCFSAIPAAEAAAMYEGSHAIIDQGYMSAKEMVIKQATPSYFSFLRPLVAPVVGKLADAVDFKYEMADHLPKIQGKVCLISNANDEVVDSGDIVRMKASLGDKQAVQEMVITNRVIKHAGAWFKDRKVKSQFENFLLQEGFANGAIL
jgi:hypothetical protein